MKDVIFSKGGGFPMSHILSTIHHNAPSWRESSLAYRMVVLINFISNSGGNPLLATYQGTYSNDHPHVCPLCSSKFHRG